MDRKRKAQEGTRAEPGDKGVTVPEFDLCPVQTWRDNNFGGQCPVREVFDRLGVRWSIEILLQLGARPHRFRDLLRDVGVISQRMLTETLRGLERDGLVVREVMSTRPLAVSYDLSPLGQSLIESLREMAGWAAANAAQMAQARAAFDERSRALVASGQIIHRLASKRALTGTPLNDGGADA